MSFPRYELYKDSGVQWLGEVPEHWEVSRSRRLFLQRKERARESDEQLTASQKLGIVSQAAFMEAEGRSVVQVIHGAEILKHVEPNDFVLSMRSFQGGLEWSGVSGCISSAYVMLVPVAKVCPAYFRHLFKSDVYIQALQTTSNLVRDGQAMRYDNFILIDLPLPSMEEQKLVARFLDAEAARIDALIQEQRRLIELLKEKRQAVISHAVTKGLHAGVPMKDSGVKDLGAVRKHWKVGPVKRYFKVLDGRRIPLSSEERGERTGDFPYYGASGIIDTIDDFIFDQDLVLVSEDGANLLNRSTPIAFIARGRYWVNNHAHILEPLDSNLFFWSERIEAIDLTPVVTGAAQPKLTIEALMNLRIAAPMEVEERNNIEDFISRESTLLIKLLNEAERAIDLLQERRSALISAAVTGKIDVRNHSPKEAA
jgi:type I restriction enzyme S subunit